MTSAEADRLACDIAKALRKNDFAAFKALGGGRGLFDALREKLGVAA